MQMNNKQSLFQTGKLYFCLFESTKVPLFLKIPHCFRKAGAIFAPIFQISRIITGNHKFLLPIYAFGLLVISFRSKSRACERDYKFSMNKKPLYHSLLIIA